MFPGQRYCLYVCVCQCWDRTQAVNMLDSSTELNLLHPVTFFGII